MSNPRIIKKYPNRRLYDTKLSRYIALADIRTLVMQGVEFQVVGARSGEDLTRSVLLQIMLDEENGDHPLFSTELLSTLIRFYDDAAQGLFARYLEESLATYFEQRGLPGKTKGTVPVEPTAEQNLKTGVEMQNSFFRAAGMSRSSRGKKE